MKIILQNWKLFSFVSYSSYFKFGRMNFFIMLKIKNCLRTKNEINKPFLKKKKNVYLLHIYTSI